MDVEKWLEENWEKCIHANMDFLDDMTEKERQEWDVQQEENMNDWADFQNEYNTMTPEKRKIYDEELDDYMLRHSLGKYRYGKELL